MTYSAGSTILASDFNGFYGPTSAGGTSGQNLGDVWGTGSTDKGWGQTLVANPAIGGQVTATQWASLVANTATAGSQTMTTTATRTPAPLAGNTILAFTTFTTNLTDITTNRGNAAAQGTLYTTGGTGTGPAKTNTVPSGWTITFTQTVDFVTANLARYFWNAGGRIVITTSKTGGTTDKDADWNALAASVGTISFVGRVNGANQMIVSPNVYTGTSVVGETGTPAATVATTTGWYSLTGGAAATQIYKKFDGVSPYTTDYIAVTAAVNAGRTAITFVTTWVDAGTGQNNAITAGATTTVNYYPPATTYLTKTWGDPTIATLVT